MSVCVRLYSMSDGKLVRLHTTNCGNTANHGYPQLIIVDILAAEGRGLMLLAGNVYRDVGRVDSRRQYANIPRI